MHLPTQGDFCLGATCHPLQLCLSCQCVVIVSSVAKQCELMQPNGDAWQMLEANLTIQEADLCPQAAIIVQIKESEPKSP